MPPVQSRRRFLLTLAASGFSATGLAACSRTGSTAASDGPQLVALYDTVGVIAAGRPQRIPFAVIDTGDLVIADDAELPVRVLADGRVVDTATVTARIVDHDHGTAEVDPNHRHADLLRYFALRTELPDPGIYDLEVTFAGGTSASLPVQAFAPDEIGLLLPGDPMPRLDTPTTAAPEGVDPLCSRAPDPCPFHDVSLADALASGSPVAYLVATPAYCATAYCGPVLDTLMAASADHPGVTLIHQEVYANASEVDGNYADPGIRRAQPLVELGLTFEPSLFLVGADGVVADRIDNIYDRSELDAALAAITPGT